MCRINCVTKILPLDNVLQVVWLITRPSDSFFFKGISFGMVIYFGIKLRQISLYTIFVTTVDKLICMSLCFSVKLFRLKTTNISVVYFSWAFSLHGILKYHVGLEPVPVRLFVRSIFNLKWLYVVGCILFIILSYLAYIHTQAKNHTWILLLKICKQGG